MTPPFGPATPTQPLNHSPGLPQPGPQAGGYPQPTAIVDPRPIRRYRRAAIWGFVFDALGVAVLGCSAFVTVLVIGALIQTGVGVTGGNTDPSSVAEQAFDLPVASIAVAFAPWLIAALIVATAFTNALLLIFRGLFGRFARMNTGGQGYLASTATWVIFLIIGFIATQIFPLAVGDIASDVFATQIETLRGNMTDSDISRDLTAFLEDYLTGQLSELTELSEQ